MGLKEDIQAKSRQRRQAERTTLFGAEIEVRGMTVGQRGHVMDVGFSKGKVPAPIMEKLYPALIAATVYEPGTDAPMFTEAEAAELVGDEVDRVAQIAMKVSGLDPQTAAELGKDSAAESDGSSSVSPAISAA